MHNEQSNPPPAPSPREEESPAPLIIPRPEHCLSRKSIDKDALKVLYRLHRSGYLAYLVGGGVRDLLLGCKPKDYDIATNAHPHQVRRLFRNSRIIGRRFRLVQILFSGGKAIEVSTFRRRSEYSANEPSMVQNENTFGTAAEDAFRRDLTINGLFYDISSFAIIDYVRGVEDLRNRVVRAIGNPDVRYVEDPIRMVRTIRHAARTGFEIEPESWGAVVRHAEKIWNCPISRVRDEFMRELREGSTSSSLSIQMRTGLLFAMFPEFTPHLGETGEHAEELQELLVAVAGSLDGRIKKGAQIPDPLLLAAFFYPYILSLRLADGAPQGHGRLAFIQRAHREVLRSISERMRLPKRHIDLASHILSAQDVIQKAADRDHVPKALRQKSYYPLSLYFYGVCAEALGIPIPPIFQRDLGDFRPGPTEPRRRKRRRNGRNSRSTAPKSAPPRKPA